MRKQLLAGVAFTAAALMGTAAFAADMPAPAPVAPPPMAPAPVPIFYDWTGFYVGAHVGYNWERKKIRYPGIDDIFESDLGDFGDWETHWISPAAHPRISADGFHGGVQLGANWQFDQWVFGLEGDWSWTNADGSTSMVLTHEWAAWPVDQPPIGEPTFSPEDWRFTFSQKIRWFGTARARIGFAFDNILLYGTGGLAWKRSELTLHGVALPGQEPEPSGPFRTSDSHTHTGWAAGLGGEVGITENVSVKAEWLYMDLGSKTYNFHWQVGDELAHMPTRVKLTEHVVRVGLNWRFVTAPAAPAPAAPAPVKW